MFRKALYGIALCGALALSTGAGAQASPADVGCPAPGQGRGPRPGGPNQPGGAPANAPGAGGGADRAGGEFRGGAGRPAGGPEAPNAGPAKKRLLIWADTRNGIAQHDIGHAIAVIEELGYKSGAFDAYIRTDSNIISRRPRMTTGEPASGGPSLCNVDAIFFLGHREIELDAQQKTDLLWFVHDAGKGFVSGHTGTTAFLSWPEFGEMIGGRFDEHPWGVIEAPVLVTDPKFPGLGKLGASFTIKDEFYQQKGFSAEKSRVLLRLDTSKLDMTRRGIQAADYPYPLAWARMYGKGRVFYSTFAHAPASWDDPRIQEMYLGAIKWALGMVDADVAPIPMPPAPQASAATPATP